MSILGKKDERKQLEIKGLDRGLVPRHSISTKKMESLCSVPRQ
jgi:hypothetical protein